MKKKKIFVLLSSLFLVVGLCFGTLSAAANEGNGGQVSTKGKITFYEETQETSEPPVSESSEPPVSESSSPPGGKLPNTGEMNKNYGLISGGIVLLLAILFLYTRKKREGDYHED